MQQWADYDAPVVILTTDSRDTSHNLIFPHFEDLSNDKTLPRAMYVWLDSSDLAVSTYAFPPLGLRSLPAINVMYQNTPIALCHDIATTRRLVIEHKARHGKLMSQFREQMNPSYWRRVLKIGYMRVS